MPLVYCEPQVAEVHDKLVTFLDDYKSRCCPRGCITGCKLGTDGHVQRG